MSYIYVASPYSSPMYLIRAERYHAVMSYMVHLFKEGRPAYSPIMHWHPAATQHDLPLEHEPWLIQDHAMLDHASHLHVLALPGWEDSRGVQAEIRRWKTNFGEPTMIGGPFANVPYSASSRLSRVES